MPSLLDELVSEVKVDNPQASEAEVCLTVTEIIEHYILPNVIRTMRIPEPSSPLENWIAKMRLRRMRQKTRKATEDRKEETKELLFDIDLAKHELGLLNVDETSFPLALLKQNSTNYPSRSRATFDVSPNVITPFLKGDGFPNSESEETKRRKEPLARLLPYVSFSEGEGAPGQRFWISKELKDRVASDYSFSRSLGVLERASEMFAENHHLEMSFFISHHVDIEIPSWEKMILEARVSNMNFEDAMALWDEYDAQIRSSLQQSIETFQGSEKKNLEDVKRKLFTRIEVK